MKISIIGAGVAGLCALKQTLRLGDDYESVLFEQTGLLGGTWNYYDQTGVDEWGVPISSAMYKNLSTNIPKEVMELEDFPSPRGGNPYISQKEVLRYLQNYAREFNLKPHIQFHKRVINVEPQGNGKWLIKIEDVKTKTICDELFDAVMVCNGHFFSPSIPKLQGLETFSGRYIHSHDYRTRDVYSGKKVLVIGAGPSGLDISQQLAEVAERTMLSFREPTFHQEGRIPKPLVKKILNDSVHFEDRSVEIVDEIIFATGYLYYFPFLSSKCGITVDNNWVKYLYKQVINVEHPTMAFIGIPSLVCPFPLCDIQVRFFLSHLIGNAKIPTKDYMLDDIHRDVTRTGGQIVYKTIHKIGLRQKKYFDDMADVAGIRRIPDVVHQIYFSALERRKKNPGQFQLPEEQIELILRSAKEVTNNVA